MALGSQRSTTTTVSSTTTGAATSAAATSASPAGANGTFVSTPLIFSFIGLGVLILTATCLLYSRRLRTMVSGEHPYYAPRIHRFHFHGQDKDEDLPARDPPQLWDLHLDGNPHQSTSWTKVLPFSATVTDNQTPPASNLSTRMNSASILRPRFHLTGLKPPNTSPNTDPTSVSEREMTLAIAVAMPSQNTTASHPVEYFIGISHQGLPAGFDLAKVDS